jgi:CRP-like cAMP-binding protein
MSPTVKIDAVSAQPENRLLARLPRKEYLRVLPLLHLAPLKFMNVLYEPRSSIDHVWFPCRGVVSALALMQDGKSIEVTTIGNEGMVGLMAFLGDEESTHRQLVQVAGMAFRMEANAFRAESSRPGPFRRLIVRYHTAFQYQMTQSVACNGLHTVHRRCCRWILMTHDRAGENEFPLTHEFLSHMLGVRRVSVTGVLKSLHDAGLIRNRRGHITVLDRPRLEKVSCECYRSVKEEFDRLLG